MQTGDYIILARYAQGWCDIGEGPFATLEDATEFAESEVGLQYVIAEVKATQPTRPR